MGRSRPSDRLSIIEGLRLIGVAPEPFEGKIGWKRTGHTTHEGDTTDVIKAGYAARSLRAGG